MTKLFTVKTTINDRGWRRTSRAILKELEDIPRDAYNKWVAETPVKSGNARRRTELQKNNIVADYPYAQRLDDGWSNQSPNGMSKPTERYVERRLREIFRKTRGG